MQEQANKQINNSIEWHQGQWEYLMGAIKQGKMSHSFVFSGQKGLGKKELALELLKVLNGNQELKAPDLIEIKPDKGFISIEQIENLQKDLALTPFQANFKAVLISEAERMNKEAQNRLLKTLEDPVQKTIFILLTSKKDILLKTILSRCQEIRFFPLSFKKMEQLFSTYKDQANFSEILFLAQGMPQLALSFFENKALFEKQQKKLEFVKQVIGANLLKRFNLSQKLFKERKEEGFNLSDFIQELISFLRWGLLSKKGITQFLEGAVLFDFPLKYDVLALKNALEKAMELQFLTETFKINKRLAFEALMLQL
ncbi:MAG: AAA family ATPase [bacterium]|nr:AAA family ATPase [bacterium]